MFLKVLQPRYPKVQLQLNLMPSLQHQPSYSQLLTFNFLKKKRKHDGYEQTAEFYGVNHTHHSLHEIINLIFSRIPFWIPPRTGFDKPWGY